MPTDIILYAIIAIVMIFWLKNTIGTLHGDEKQRPNPFDQMDQDKEKQGEKDIVHALNTMNKDRVEGTAQDKTNAGLVQIALADKTFDMNQFRENAGDAFSIIVTAFADGDRDTLRDLCAHDVYDAFDRALRDREAKGEKVSTEIHSIRKSDIVDAGIDNRKTAFITLRFTADETYVIRDRDGNILAGHPDRVTEMTDKWTFSRDIKSSDPRWLLSKTEDDVVEADGKTPVPDAG